MTETEEIFVDRIIGFTLPRRGARGRIVRLDAALEEILAAHAYPASIRLVLAEALVLCVLMGSLLKESGSQLTLQAQTEDGPVRLLVCDYRDGALRGYADFDPSRIDRLGANPSLERLFGKGYLAITFDPANGKRYQGVVPLEGHSLAQACETYFIRSEQIPTVLLASVHQDAQGIVAGGLLVQHLPEGEEGGERLATQEEDPDWEHVCVLARSLSHEELVDRKLSLQTILWRLFHEEGEIRIFPGPEIRRGCRCSEEYFTKLLARFSDDDMAEMRNERGRIEIDCAFCSRKFVLNG